MPDRDPGASPNARLLTVLIWAGVGLAPVAALVVLLGGSTSSIRFAVLLVAVCVVLIGAALLIRNDPVLLKMDVEDRVEALREELREEIMASAHAGGNRIRALQDEMTRMRAAGSPAMGLPPAAARAAAQAGPVPAAVPGRATVSVPGRTEGWAAEGDQAPAQMPPGRPTVATASVAPPGGHTAVARIPAVAAVAPVTGSASVPLTTTGPRAAGSAVVAAAAVPHQRGAAVVPPTSGSTYQVQAGYGAEDDGAEAEPQAFGGYGPGTSGSAWAERSEATQYSSGGYDEAEPAPPAEPRPARRHAAPDTGTDLARYGLGSPAAPAPQTYGTATPETRGTGYGADETGDASWTGTGDYTYTDPAAPSAFGIETSSFFADAEAEPDEDVPAPAGDYPQPPDPYAQNGYGPDPMGPHHGWAPRSQEHPGRW